MTKSVNVFYDHPMFLKAKKSEFRTIIECEKCKKEAVFMGDINKSGKGLVGEYFCDECSCENKIYISELTDKRILGVFKKIK